VSEEAAGNEQLAISFCVFDLASIPPLKRPSQTTKNTRVHEGIFAFLLILLSRVFYEKLPELNKPGCGAAKR
jgi:hypothetical protein